MSKLTRPRILLGVASLGVAAVAALGLLFVPKHAPPSFLNWSGKPLATKSIALTFTDGPDSVFTPQILAKLGKYHTRSTFVVSPEAAFSHPGLVKRILAEGHQIALESEQGRKPVANITGRDARMIFHALENDLDPRDDRLGVNKDGSGDLRTPEQLVAAVMWQISQGGRTDVLHLRDGGGDRKLTVEGLDLLIPQLQSRGFQLVTAADLLGKSKADVLPGLVKPSPWPSKVLTTVSIGGLLLGLSQLLLLIPRPKKRVPNYRFHPTVSILIPAFNTEEDISDTVRCMLESDFEVSEVIVVDDGSSDETFSEVVTRFAGEPRLITLHRVRGGRAAALNQAMTQARGEILLCIDGGVAVSSNAVGALVAYLHDPEVGAAFASPPVSHMLRKRDPDISAWRKSAVIEVGGWTETDLELAEKLRQAGWSTVLRPARHASDSLIPINLPSSSEPSRRASVK